jgi:transcriptional regulator NrdR family protein
MSGVQCSACGSGRTRVYDSRDVLFRGIETQRRRRRCHDCGEVTVTHEFSQAHLSRIDKIGAGAMARELLEAAISLSNKLS